MSTVSESRINAVEIRWLRKTCGVTLAEQVCNIEVRQRLDLIGSVSVKIRKGILV